MNLVDLESGDVPATASFENPQRFGGSDIMHRISYDGGEHAGELRQVLLSSINFEIGEMSRQLRFHRRRIYDVVVVGNATMRDILFGVDVQSIGQKPYKSLIELEMDRGERTGTSLNTTARELGLRVFPGANVYGGPLVGCHVGADVTADLLAIGMDEEEDVVMLVDVGTNTEVVVGNRHGMMAASCPAGPAFEGGEITYGMPGYEGAVESVEIGESGVVCRTIGGLAPQGICGSGLVDLLAELRRTGMMNELGVFADGGGEFAFAPEQGMSVSRADVSALAQAKSANFSGQRIVLRRYGVTPGGDLEAVPRRGVRQLRGRQQRGEHRLHRGRAAGAGGEGGKRGAGGRDADAGLAADARGGGADRGPDRARGAGDDAGLLRGLRRGVHVQADGGVGGVGTAD